MSGKREGWWREVLPAVMVVAGLAIEFGVVVAIMAVVILGLARCQWF